jgi:multicomponent Na+:H+ antiporter subunit D
MNFLVPLVVLLPLLGAASALIAGRRPRLQATLTVVALSATLAVAIALLITVDTGGTIVVEVGGWPAPWGIVLVADRLAALMVVTSAAVLLAVFIYTIGQGLADGDDETPVSIYNPTYLVMAAGVFNAFIAGDLFNLYVGFEILLAASYVLLTLGGTRARIHAGVTYIVVSLLSSLLFLAAVAMIYGATGTVNIAQISERIAEIPPDVQTIIHVMLLVAFGIKAAVFPLSFWLPDSYPTAPAPVTAVFAGLLTKVGVYAILRTETVIFPGGALSNVLMVVALLTLVIGVLGAVAQADIKRLLSFTLLSHIGYMIFGIAIGTVIGIAAAIYYIIHHIIVQTTLFLATGLVERIGGTTSLTRLGGLLKLSPIVGVLFFIPALNLGGIPPFSGFIGKLGLFIAGAELGTPLSYILIAAGAVTSLLTLYALMRAWNLAFWRPKAEADATGVSEPGDEATASAAAHLTEAPGATQTMTARSAPRLMTRATAAMVLLSLALTVFAGPLYEIAHRAAQDLDGPGAYVHAVLGSDDAP